jgi:hypothetical protein
MANPPTGTVTFLFTDIEGSTKIWELHPHAMQKALSRHDEILRGAMEKCGEGPEGSAGGVGIDHRPQGPRGCLPFSTAWDFLRISLLRASVNRPFGSASHSDDYFSLSVSISDITNSFRDLF